MRIKRARSLGTSINFSRSRKAINEIIIFLMMCQRHWPAVGNTLPLARDIKVISTMIKEYFK